MRGEQRRHDPGGAFGVEASEDLQHAQLGGAIEAVAGFGFDGGGAGAQHPVAMLACGGQQVIFGRGAGKSDGAQDATAGSGDLLIGGACDALLELGGAVASEAEMGVGIDEAGSDAAAAGINNHCVGRNLGFDLGTTAGRSNAALFDEKGGVGDEAEFAKFGADSGARWAGEGDELPDVDDGGGHKAAYVSRLRTLTARSYKPCASKTSAPILSPLSRHTLISSGVRS